LSSLSADGGEVFFPSRRSTRFFCPTLVFFAVVASSSERRRTLPTEPPYISFFLFLLFLPRICQAPGTYEKKSFVPLATMLRSVLLSGIIGSLFFDRELPPEQRIFFGSAWNRLSPCLDLILVPLFFFKVRSIPSFPFSESRLLSPAFFFLFLREGNRPPFSSADSCRLTKDSLTISQRQPRKLRVAVSL